MERLTDLQRENSARQTELINIVVGYHEGRLRRGHPFALNVEVENLTARKHRGPKHLFEALRGKERQPLDLSVPSADQSPLERIRKGIVASMWDSYNQIYGLIDASQHPEFHPLILDKELGDFMEEMDRVGDKIIEQAASGSGNSDSYSGFHTVHAGLEVGIGMLTTLSAIDEGIAGSHPFDPIATAKIVAKGSQMQLSINQMNLGALFPLAPDHIKNFLDDKTKLGIEDRHFREMTAMMGYGCPAMFPMGDIARRILQRHDLYFEEFEGRSPIEIIGGKIREYVRQQIDQLRIEMDFHDSARLPEFDRRVVDRTILDPPVSDAKKS